MTISVILKSGKSLDLTPEELWQVADVANEFFGHSEVAARKEQNWDRYHEDLQGRLIADDLQVSDSPEDDSFLRCLLYKCGLKRSPVKGI
jgi:hypothetical protein